jgi:pyridoxine/pyridoxamine 5'-phosphate oxidase
MPRYFFDLHNDTEAPDYEGKVLPDVEAAKADALDEARAMIKASIDETGRIDLRHYISVRDESGAVVFNMHFEDAVAVQRGEQVLSRPSAAG